MAKRYSGALVLNVRYYDDVNGYAVVIACNKVSTPAMRPVRLAGIKLSPFDQERLAVDSREAYDKVAQAALSFGTSESCVSEDEANAVLSRLNYNAAGESLVSRRASDAWKAG